MESQTKIIRDFIYLDADRLYSLYSQISEGVADLIIKSFESNQIQTERPKALSLTSKSLEEQVGEASRRTENTILHDYLYNQLENKLENIIVEPIDLSNENYDSVLKETEIVKITGQGTIQDYDHLYSIVEQFNEMGAKFAKLQVNSEEYRLRVELLKGMIKKEQDRGTKEIYQTLLKQATDLKEYVKANNLYLDEDLRFLLKTFTELFAPEAFHIMLARSGEEAIAKFRCVINQPWLRVNPDLLRALYGGNDISNLTMVGQITHIPAKNPPPALAASQTIPVDDAAEIEEQLNEQTEQELKTDPGSNEVSIGNTVLSELRSGLNQMFTGMNAMDQMFFAGRDPVEIAVSPIAIYREVQLPSIKPAEANQPSKENRRRN